MKREIKFRLHDKDGEKVGYEFHEPNEFGVIQLYHQSLRGDFLEDSKQLVRKNFYIPHFTKCQYTGLEDKNGKEIYEGDIVRYNHATEEGNKQYGFPKWNGVVYWESGTRYAWRIQPVDKNKLDDNFYYDFEVIGNIYEHPHLLNSEQNPEVSDTTGDDQRTEPTPPNN